MIDFSKKLMSLRDKSVAIRETVPKPDGTVEVGEELTLGTACITALMGNYQDETTLNGSDKLRRFRLAEQINDATEPLVLKVEDIDLMKRLIPKAFGVLVTGRALPLLDPAENEKQ